MRGGEEGTDGEGGGHMEREKRKEGGIVDREIANRENTARSSRH